MMGTRSNCWTDFASRKLVVAFEAFGWSERGVYGCGDSYIAGSGARLWGSIQ